MNKRLIACILVSCITFFALPFNVFAVSAGVGVAFGSLAPIVVEDFYIALKEVLEGIFGSGRDSISYGGSNYSYDSTFNDIKISLDSNPDSLTAIPSVSGNDVIYSFIYTAPTLNNLFFDLLIGQAASNYNKSEIHYSSDGASHSGGGRHRPVSEAISDIDSSTNAIFDELGIIDNGKSLFDRFFSLYNISAVEAIPIEPFTLKLTPSSIQVGDPCFSYAVVRHYPGQSSKLEFYSQSLQNPYYNWFGGEIVHSLSVSGDDFNLTQNNSSMLYGKISQLASPYIYKFYFPTGQDYKDMAWYGNLAVTDDDLVALPGINFDSKSDLEKAAEMLAQQLGVDINRILDEFSLVYDENGKRYFESVTGVRTAVDELVKAYNETISGNAAIIDSLQKLLEQIKAQDISVLESYVANIEDVLNGLNARDEDREALLSDLGTTLGEIKDKLGNLTVEVPQDLTDSIAAIKEQVTAENEREKEKEKLGDDLRNKYIDIIRPIVDTGFTMTKSFNLYDQCKYLLNTLFNRDDTLSPPVFAFYYDSNKDGIEESYTILDLNFMEQELDLSNARFTGSTAFRGGFRLIEIVRYIIAAVLYSLFIGRLLKRLSTFYGTVPLL